MPSRLPTRKHLSIHSRTTSTDIVARQQDQPPCPIVLSALSHPQPDRHRGGLASPHSVRRSLRPAPRGVSMDTRISPLLRRSKHSSTCMEDSDGGPICAPPALPLCRPAPAHALAPRAAAHRPLRALQPVSSSPPPPLRPPVSTLPPSPLVDNSLQPTELRPLLTPRMHDGQ